MPKPEVCAIILARAGSRRLKRKNLLSLCGKPLMAYTIEAARRSKYITRIICSTDSRAIADLAARCGAEVPFIRPKRLALDRTTSADSLIHALNYMRKKERYVPDCVVMLQLTSPMRTSRHIDRALELFYSRNPKSVISVKKIREKIGSIKNIINGRLRPAVKKTDTRELYCPNGAVYAASPEIIYKRRKFWTDETIPYVMDDISSIDIDTKFDLKVAGMFMRQRNRDIKAARK